MIHRLIIQKCSSRASNGWKGPLYFQPFLFDSTTDGDGVFRPLALRTLIPCCETKNRLEDAFCVPTSSVMATTTNSRATVMCSSTRLRLTAPFVKQTPRRVSARGRFLPCAHCRNMMDLVRLGAKLELRLPEADNCTSMHMPVSNCIRCCCCLQTQSDAATNTISSDRLSGLHEQLGKKNSICQMNGKSHNGDEGDVVSPISLLPVNE